MQTEQEPSWTGRAAPRTLAVPYGASHRARQAYVKQRSLSGWNPASFAFIALAASKHAFQVGFGGMIDKGQRTQKRYSNSSGTIFQYYKRYRSDINIVVSWARTVFCLLEYFSGAGKSSTVLQ